MCVCIAKAGIDLKFNETSVSYICHVRLKICFFCVSYCVACKEPVKRVSAVGYSYHHDTQVPSSCNRKSLLVLNETMQQGWQ